MAKAAAVKPVVVQPAAARAAKAGKSAKAGAVPAADAVASAVTDVVGKHPKGHSGWSHFEDRLRWSKLAKRPEAWAAAGFVLAGGLTFLADVTLPDDGTKAVDPKTVKTSLMDFGVAGAGVATLVNFLNEGKEANPVRSLAIAGGLWVGIIGADMAWGMIGQPKYELPGIRNIDSYHADPGAAQATPTAPEPPSAAPVTPATPAVPTVPTAPVAPATPDRGVAIPIVAPGTPYGAAPVARYFEAVTQPPVAYAGTVST